MRKYDLNGDARRIIYQPNDDTVDIYPSVDPSVNNGGLIRTNGTVPIYNKV